jgi:beta-glucosidase
MNLTRCFALAGTLAILLSGCAASTSPSPTPPSPPPAAPHAIHPELWPPAAAPLASDPVMERAIDELLGRMTLEEKVGQVIQPSITTITPEDVRAYKFGSVLNGGGGWPGDIRKATAADWLALADAFHEASMDTSGGRQAIPVIWGSDAVHGHSNVIGATLFPHNVGLGAMRNPELIRRIGEVTAAEMSVTGIDWNFSPTVAVALDDRWGRAYESYSEDPELVRVYAEEMVGGLQGDPDTADFFSRGRVIATAKHFVGDGGTVGGKDQGDNVATEAELRDIHAQGYYGAMESGVQVVMASYNSWHGVKMHGNRALLTDVLRGRMGFDGIVVGDWNGHNQIPGCTNTSCAHAFNAGIDIFMVPEDWKGLYETTLAQVRSGEIRAARLDEAVRRILRVKMRAGLFTAGKPSERGLGGDFSRFGSAEHRAVARQAVRESLVLLKNDRGVLPLRPGARVLVAGDGANSIAKQSGGWTITWQGDGNKNDDFPNATSIWEGLRAAVQAAGGLATLSPDGSYEEKPDVAVVVYGEDPYAEFQGDRRTIIFNAPRELSLLQRLRADGIPVVSVFLSGRPLWVNPFLNDSDAFVAAWLPGSEGAGIADVLVAAPDGAVRHDFKGNLSFSWPKLPTQVVLNRGDAGYDPLFPLGFGLTYADRVTLSRLPVDTAGITASDSSAFYSGQPVAPWELVLSDSASMRLEREGQEGQAVHWTGPGEISLRSNEPVDLTRESNGNLALSVDLMRRSAIAGRVGLAVGSGEVDITPLVRALPEGAWSTVRIRLRCFERAGADMRRIDRPLRIVSDAPLSLSFAEVRLVAGTDESPCP